MKKYEAFSHKRDLDYIKGDYIIGKDKNQHVGTVYKCVGFEYTPPRVIFEEIANINDDFPYKVGDRRVSVRGIWAKRYRKATRSELIQGKILLPSVLFIMEDE